MKIYRFFHVLLAGFFRLWYRVKAEGLENEPSEGGYVVCANHLSNDDVIVIGATLKRPLRFLAKKELFKIPLVNLIVKMFGAYPVDRKSAASGASSVKATVQLVEAGEVVAMFPQGTRMPGVDPRDTEFKHGIGLIEYRAKTRILPICIQTKKWKVLPFRRTVVRIGKPIEYEEFTFTNGGMDEYTAAAKLVFDRICSMVEDSSEK